MSDTIHDMQPVVSGKKSIVLRSRQFGTSFFSFNDGQYEADWHELVGTHDTAHECQAVIGIPPQHRSEDI